VLLVIQIVPYFMTGFESVPKCAEEANPNFRVRGFFRAIMLAILVGVAFYVSVIAIVAYVHPWQALLGEKFLTAAVFKQAFRSSWIVKVILAAALLSLLKVFNGNFVAASRLFFALGRRGLINHHLGRIHPRNLTPTHAVLLVGFLTVVGTLAGEAILIPITEVGSMASACGWLAACAAYLRMERNPRRRALAVAGLLVALGLVLMKLVPLFPGHLSLNECAALVAWLLAGLALKHRKTESVR
jgi:amino acid transporter